MDNKIQDYSNIGIPEYGSKKKEPKRKRQLDPSNWKKEKRKRAILAGQPYINTKGDQVCGKVMGPDCNCKLLCFTKVTYESRLSIFDAYYSLKSYDEQNSYLYGLIKSVDIRRRKNAPVNSRRHCSYKYYVRIKGKEIQVCKKAFENIHGIKEKKIRTLCVKHEKNILFPRDNRGKHNNRPKKVTSGAVTMIKSHILQVLTGTKISDFFKKEKNKTACDVNVSKMYKDFLRMHQPEVIDEHTDKVKKDAQIHVKSWLYFKVFRQEFHTTEYSAIKRKLSDFRKGLQLLIDPSSRRMPPKAAKAKKKPAPKVDTSPNDYSHPQPNINLALMQTPVQPYIDHHRQHQNDSNPSNSYQTPTNLENCETLTNNFCNQQTLTAPQPTQSYPLNFSSAAAGNPASPYYLCLGQFSHFLSSMPNPQQVTSVPQSQAGNTNNHITSFPRQFNPN